MSDRPDDERNDPNDRRRRPPSSAGRAERSGRPSGAPKRNGPRRESSSGVRDGQRGGSRDGQRGGPRDGQRGGPRDGQRGGPRDAQRGGPRDGQRDGQRGGPRGRRDDAQGREYRGGSNRSGERSTYGGDRARRPAGGRDERSAGGRAGRSGESRYSNDRSGHGRPGRDPRDQARGPRERDFARSDRGNRRDEDLPAVPENVDASTLDRSVRAELRSLSKANAEAVGNYLVAAGELLDDNPQRALALARAARARAARVGAVREAVGIAAYHAGEWAEALSELRTARRITGDARNLALMADCERALGRPAQALRTLNDTAVAGLDRESRIELFIVIAGARRDLGQLDAALAVLARGGLDREHPRPGSVRLWYAYADALEAAGRKDEAAQWFAASAAIDPEGELDAADRAAALL